MLEVAQKGGVFVQRGYEALDGSSALYRTLVSRGWGPLDTPDDGPIFNEIACALARSFSNAEHPLAYYGFMLSQLWGGPFSPIPWGTQPLEDVYGATPFGEVTDCADPHIEFYPDEVAADLLRAIAGDGINNPLGPRGVTHLLNEITDDGRFLELLEYVRGLDWPIVYKCGSGEVPLLVCNNINVTFAAVYSSTFVRADLIQYRRRFPVPPSGSVRFEWDIYWIPEDTGIPVLYDTISWQWDGVVPPGYDAADPETWPITPWYDMPEYDPNLGYGSFRIQPADWRVICDVDIAPDAPGAIAAKNI